MRQLKVYKNLTVGYNFAIFLATALALFSLSLPTTVLAEDGARVYEAAPATNSSEEDTQQETQQSVAPQDSTTPNITINTGNQETEQARAQRICRENESSLNESIRRLNSACASTRLGSDCVGKLFACADNLGDSEECEKIREYESGATRDELDHEIEVLKKKKDKLSDEKSDLKDKSEELQSVVDEINEQREDLLTQKNETEDELKEGLKENQSAAARQAEQMQAGIEALQNEIRKTHDASLEYTNQMTDLIATERLKCMADGQKRAEQFVTKYRQCMQGTGRCGVTQATIINTGHRSLNDLGSSLKTKHIRRCMALNNSTEFGVKYAALQAKILNQERLLARNRALLTQKQLQLQQKIMQIPNQKSINDTQMLLDKAQADQRLTQEEQTLLMKQMQNAVRIAENAKEIEEKQKEIDEVENEIKKKEKQKAQSLRQDDLRRFKEAMAEIGSIKNSAEAAAAGNCECTGSLLTINNYSGGSVCSGSAGDTDSTYTPNGTR